MREITMLKTKSEKEADELRSQLSAFLTRSSLFYEFEF